MVYEKDYNIKKLLKDIRTQCLSKKGKKTIDPKFRCFELPDTGLFVYLDDENETMMVTSEDISNLKNGYKDLRMHIERDEYPAIVKAIFYDDMDSIDLELKTTITNFDGETRVWASVIPRNNVCKVFQNHCLTTRRELDWWSSLCKRNGFESAKTVLRTLEEAIEREERHTPETKQKLIGNFSELENLLAIEASNRNLLADSKEQLSGNNSEIPNFGTEQVAGVLMKMEGFAGLLEDRGNYEQQK